MNENIKALCGVELIQYLSLLFGPTGCEDRVRDAIALAVEDLCDAKVCDRMGNLICRISLGDPDKRKKIMLSAHMDEVGFMIEEIKKDGMLTFGCVGGIDPSVLAGKRALIEGNGELLNGVICSKAIHHKTKKERKKATESDKLYIDLGFTSDEDAKESVAVGALATFLGDFFLMGKDMRTMCSKALDDRMGCALLIELMRKIREEKPLLDLDIYFCFTVGEETGHSGAIVAAERIAPDFALIFESTAIGDLPETVESRRVAEVTKGAVISVADRSTIYDKELIDLAFDCAKKDGIPLQVKKYLSGGNDAGHIHKSGAGVRSLAVSVPTRYLHSAACVASLDDYESALNIAYSLLYAIDGDDLK